MNKRIISSVLSLSMAASMLGGFATTAFAANTPKYQTQARQMEQLNRGLIAVYRTKDSQNVNKTGVYLSWRLLGDEPLESQEYDIYKNDTYLATTTGVKGTNYIDESGKITDTYKVVKTGADAAAVAKETAVTPVTNHVAATSQYTTLANSFSYVDIPLMRPDPVKSYDGDMSYYYTLDSDHEGGANDASLGDLDGDGDYEMILKWDPTNSKDTVNTGTSGNVYIDAYEITTDTDNFKWRIDLGQSIRAGAHDTQILVYDFDGDGKSEVVTQTAPGSVDSTGRYVTEVGDTEEIRNTDNTNIQLSKGHNIGADFYTVFDGDTGVALYTTAGIPLGSTNGSDWGDSKLQRAHRFLGAVAYLDGVHPCIVMCRGYYNRAVVRAYTWDGAEMTLLWEHDGKSKGAESLYGQGNHNLSVADVDNDGKDEVVYGSAVLDDNGKAMGNTYLGHGDAMHVNDFNNDGQQEVFSVKEDSEGYKTNAADFRVASTGKNIFGVGASGDTGRGVMDNIDDDYAKANPNGLALGWTSNHNNVFDLTGAELKAKPSSAGKGSFDNFLVYWDADLGRELLDANIIQKYDADTGYTTRFWGESDGYTLTGATTNNYTKRNPSLVADHWGDWREEIIMPYNKTSEGTAYLRIFTSTLPTDYRLTTLMHDSQYRMAIAWQNVGYNQPPHTSYYVGSVALATDDSGNTLNYLAPATAYTNVTYEQPESVAVTGVKLSESEVTVEKGESVTISAIIAPEAATKKSVTWTSSDEKIATVTNGTIKGTGEGEATITATTRDGGFTATCKVTVYQKHATGVSLSTNKVEVGTGGTAQIKAYVEPSDATDQSVTWTSADESIATVDKNGVVTGIIDGEGTTTVTATTVDGGYTASCTVNVFPLATTDETGWDSFAFATENTDANTTLDASANSAALTHADSNSGATVQKKFAAYSDNKATLSFRFTTGGQKYDGSNWNWDGHEYSFGLRFLDTNGNNIITLSQAYKTKGETIMCQIGDASATGLIDSWTKVIDSAGDVQGSAKRWNVTMEFDYDKDTCTVTLVGTDSTWELENAKYTKTFSLGGASFETMQLYTTKDGDGTIKAAPNLANVEYLRTVALIPRDKVSVTGYEGNEVSYKGVITNKYDSVAVIGAVYDNGTLVEVKSNTVENPTVVEAVDGESFTGSFAFDTDIQGKEVKVYLWDSLNGMQPLSSKATYNVPAADATPTPEPTPTPTPKPT
ncbi:MAG: Ig-like domain-containing protein, partial [Clostridia bacterium]|nr:Ig-like domain-containing protein [Clostridia bacterium]